MELTEETAVPFGSQAEVLELLCNTPGFERDWVEENHCQKVIDEWCREQEAERGGQFTSVAYVRYIYPHRKGVGRSVSYSLQENPVICISVRKT